MSIPSCDQETRKRFGRVHVREREREIERFLGDIGFTFFAGLEDLLMTPTLAGRAPHVKLDKGFPSIATIS